MLPHSTTFPALSDAIGILLGLPLNTQELDFPINYFYKKIDCRLNTPVFFRSLKTAEKRDREMLRTRIGWMIEIYAYFKRFLDFADINIDRREKEEYSQDEIEKIAVDVRKNWGLGLGLISNIVLLLENNGFILSKNKFRQAKS